MYKLSIKQNYQEVSFTFENPSFMYSFLLVALHSAEKHIEVAVEYVAEGGKSNDI